MFTIFLFLDLIFLNFVKDNVGRKTCIKNRTLLRSHKRWMKADFAIKSLFLMVWRAEVSICRLACPSDTLGRTVARQMYLKMYNLKALQMNEITCNQKPQLFSFETKLRIYCQYMIRCSSFNESNSLENKESLIIILMFRNIFLKSQTNANFTF